MDKPLIILPQWNENSQQISIFFSPLGHIRAKDEERRKRRSCMSLCYDAYYFKVTSYKFPFTSRMDKPLIILPQWNENSQQILIFFPLGHIRAKDEERRKRTSCMSLCYDMYYFKATSYTFPFT